MINNFPDDEYVQNLISDVCDSIRVLLISKNKKYGNSALNPVQIFCKSDPLTAINARIDDKLSRIANNLTNDDEDPELDLIGYLILKRVAKKIYKDLGV